MVKRKKGSLAEKISFPSGASSFAEATEDRSTERALRLNFELQPGGHGLRLTIYSDSIEPVEALPQQNRNGLSRATIQRRGPVQKLITVNPRTIQAERSRLPADLPASSGSSFLRTCLRGGVTKFILRSVVLSWPQS